MSSRGRQRGGGSTSSSTARIASSRGRQRGGDSESTTTATVASSRGRQRGRGSLSSSTASIASSESSNTATIASSRRPRRGRGSESTTTASIASSRGLQRGGGGKSTTTATIASSRRPRRGRGSESTTTASIASSESSNTATIASSRGPQRAGGGESTTTATIASSRRLPRGRGGESATTTSIASSRRLPRGRGSESTTTASSKSSNTATIASNRGPRRAGGGESTTTATITSTRGRQHDGGSEGSSTATQTSTETDFLGHGEVLTLGLKYAGFRQEKMADRTMQTRFAATYGLCPESFASLFVDLFNSQTAQFKRPRPRDLFVVLNWLKTYCTEHVMAGRWNLDEKTIRGLIWSYLPAIQALLPQKVIWPPNTTELTGDDKHFIITVDGVHIRIQEPRMDPGTKWYSHKSHSAGLTYELGISLAESKLVWINGPFPASTSDLVMYRKPDGLKSKIPPNALVIADGGYNNEPTISAPNPCDSAAVRKFKNRARARHESFNGRIKNFQALANGYRNQLSKHQCLFEACCVLIQYELDHGHPIFDI